MAQTTFSGPVKSQRGFVTAGPDSIVNITAETTLTFAAHAGKVIKVNDADGKSHFQQSKQIAKVDQLETMTLIT